MYNKIALIDPHVEVILKKLYWRNVKYFKKFKPRRSKTLNAEVNWNEVVEYLSQAGIKEGSFMLLHSSYEALASSKLSPGKIIDSLRTLLGPDGTLAMPVFRTFSGEPDEEHELTADLTNLVCTYNLQETSSIWTGLLPYFLTRENDVAISRCPINPLAAVGKLAEPMMANNITESVLPPCGVNSSWAFSVEHDAIVVGMGIDLCHSLTITHVAADLNMDEWPVRNWYRKRIFNIVDKSFRSQVTILEREPKWGNYFLPNINYRNDLIKNKILISKIIGGVVVETVRARELISFIRSRNNPVYPYCIPKKYFK